MGTSSNDTSSNDDDFFTGTFDDPGEPGFSGPAYEGQDSDPSEDLRESATEPGKTYNFNINREADFSVDDQGRRVYETLDQTQMDLYEASGQFDKLDQLFKSGQVGYLKDDGTIVSEDYEREEKMNLISSQFDALDAIEADPQYADRKSLLTSDGQVLVEHPSDFYSNLVSGGALLASAIPGAVLAPLAMDFLYTPAVNSGLVPLTAQTAGVSYGVANAAATGSLFFTPTFQAKAWQNPISGENVYEQTLNLFGKPVDRRFTTESEFIAQREEEARIKELYDNGDQVGDATALVETKTGKSKPSWRDYVNTDFDFETLAFNTVVGAGVGAMSQVAQDAVALGRAVAEGQSPLDALINIYGADIAETLNLEEIANSAIFDVFPESTAEFLTSNSDLVNLGADIVVHGQDPVAAIRNNYGDKILGLMQADSTNARAAGNAGLSMIVNLDRGKDIDNAFGQGVVDYFKQGGTVDMLIENPDTFSSMVANLDIDLPDVNLPDLNIDWKGTWDITGRSANELLPAFEVADLFDMNFELGDFNWEGVDVSGMNLGDFTAQGYNLTDLEEVGIELPDLNIDIPEIEFELQLAQLQEKIPGEKVTTSGEVVQSLEPDLDFLEEDGLTFSRRLLQRTV